MDFREFIGEIVKVNKEQFEKGKKIAPHMVFEDNKGELNIIIFAGGNEVDFRRVMEIIVRTVKWRNMAVILSGELKNIWTGEKLNGMIVQAVSVDGDVLTKVITEKGEEESKETGGYLSLSTILKDLGV